MCESMQKSYQEKAPHVYIQKGQKRISELRGCALHSRDKQAASRIIDGITFTYHP